MNILLVDDEEMTLVALSKKLREQGYTVSVATNTIEALKAVKEEKIDLIISDIIMPMISGFTLLSMLKNFYYLSLPVILISSYNQENVLLKSHSLGASDFVSKPINYDELFYKIEKYGNRNNAIK